jgi:hypothetical protein
MKPYFEGTCWFDPEQQRMVPGNRVKALPFQTFEELVEDVCEHPIQIDAYTKAQFLKLPPERRNDIKAVNYLTPAEFVGEGNMRFNSKVAGCNLIFFDVDQVDASKHLIAEKWAPLKDYKYLVWKTANHTVTKPRLRVMVATEGLSRNEYPIAVSELAKRLGITPTNESLKPVQPMYRPIRFRGEKNGSFILAKHLQGKPYPHPTGAAPGPEIKELNPYQVSPRGDISLETVRKALSFLSPDLSMFDWLKVGMGLKHEFGEDGLLLWDEFSSRSKTKYPGAPALKKRWNSFVRNPPDREPTTIDTLLSLARGAGWKVEGVHTTLEQWIKDPTRTNDELLEKGPARIADTDTDLSGTHQDLLMELLWTTLKKRGLAVKKSTLDKETQRCREKQQSLARPKVPPWAENLIYLMQDEGCFYNTKTHKAMSYSVLETMHPSPTKQKTREWLVQTVKVPTVANLRFDPTQPPSEIFSDAQGGRYFNTFLDSYPKKEDMDPARIKWAGGVYREHLRRLIREPEYQTVLIDFFAHLVQHPEIKITWCPLLQSTGGVGKTWLCRLAAATLGSTNAYLLEGLDLLETKYNGWATDHLLVVIEEVRTNNASRHSVVDRLKTVIANPRVSVTDKYVAQRNEPNFTSYIALTNHRDALALSDDDRRYFVLQSPLQRKEDRRLFTRDYFAQLEDVEKNWAAELRQWLLEWPISAEFNAKGDAPDTHYKGSMAEIASSTLAYVTRNIIQDQPHALVRKDLISLSVLRELVSAEPGVASYSDQYLAKVLYELGYEPIGQHLLAGKRHSLWTYGSIKNSVQKARERLELL